MLSIKEKHIEISPNIKSSRHKEGHKAFIHLLPEDYE